VSVLLLIHPSIHLSPVFRDSASLPSTHLGHQPTASIHPPTTDGNVSLLSWRWMDAFCPFLDLGPSPDASRCRCRLSFSNHASTAHLLLRKTYSSVVPSVATLGKIATPSLSLLFVCLSVVLVSFQWILFLRLLLVTFPLSPPTKMLLCYCQRRIVVPRGAGGGGASP
jgi:hypothetical protein